MNDSGETTLELQGIREDVRETLKTFSEKLRADLGDNLESLTVVGSVLTGDYNPKRSDINTVLVVGRRSHDLLKLLASYGEKMGKLRIRAPLLMTGEYIEQSLDVFGVEFLDFQLNHVTVCGNDPFADLQFRKEDVRLQCERDLKSALIQLRQGYISALGRTDAVADMLLACVGQLVSLTRAMLWLADIDRPLEAKATLIAASRQFQCADDMLLTLLESRQQHRRPNTGVIEPAFEATYQVIDQLSRTVDTMRAV